MGLEWEQTIVDAADPASLGSWWRDALGWILDPDAAEDEPRHAGFGSDQDHRAGAPTTGAREHATDSFSS